MDKAMFLHYKNILFWGSKNDTYHIA